MSDARQIIIEKKNKYEMKITLYKNYRKFCLQSKEYNKVTIPHATV